MNLQEFGNVIRKRRKYLQLSQIDLSQITGIGRRSLQYIENGQMNPSFEQLEKILEALGLELTVKVKINE